MDNVATMQLTPGYKKFHNFCDNAPPNHHHDPIIMQPATAISDDEDNGEAQDDWDEFMSEREKGTAVRAVANNRKNTHGKLTKPTTELTTTNFDLNGTNGDNIPEVNIIEEDVQSINLSAELLRIHHRMGHALFTKLQELAKQGALLARLKNCPIPMCTACAYGKASRKACPANSQIHLQPGDIVSVDQMVSLIPGLIAQITGILTTKRYNYATVYLDQATRLGYVHLQKSATADETLEGKEVFEAYARGHWVAIRAYHADNGMFCAHKWVDCCRLAKQGLTFAGVSSHDENGIAERRIKELQDLARTMLINANWRWEMSVKAHLWPCAVRMASKQVNNTPRMQSKAKKTPMQELQELKHTPT
jgi:transposase InsO family protein